MENDITRKIDTLVEMSESTLNVDILKPVKNKLMKILK